MQVEFPTKPFAEQVPGYLILALATRDRGLRRGTLRKYPALLSIEPG